MTADLYKDDLNQLPGGELYRAIEAFTRVLAPFESRPQENYRLDFKQEWSDGALKTVAAFANTFGGVLIIGVSEKDGRPDCLVGIESAGELKTRIASSIASNISPTPSYEVGECTTPEKRLCVVRVRKGTQLHFLTKKGESPVYVRNEDESRPADAARLQALIADRLSARDSEHDLVARTLVIRSQLFVTTAGITGEAAEQEKRVRQRSNTALVVAVIPFAGQRLELDRSVENKFHQMIRKNYPQIFELDGSMSRREDRGRDWFEYSLLHNDRDYERKWRLNSSCEFAYASQMKVSLEGAGDHWSLCDVAGHLIFTLRAAKDLWDFAGYLGSARLGAYLDVPGLALAYYGDRHPYGFPSLFHNSHLSIDARACSREATPVSHGSAEADVNYASVTTELSDNVGLVLNQLLRALGRDADLGLLRSEAEHLTTVKISSRGFWGGYEVG